MEYVGYVILAALFAFPAYNHVKSHAALVGYTASTSFPVPYLGGWPTGVVLAAIAVLVALGTTVGFIAAAAFLAITAVYFHSNIKDPANLKHVALIGSFVALAALSL